MKSFDQILLIAILFISFAYRITEFRVPHYHYHGDYNRDYLIANHIIKYGEIPLNGHEGELGPAGTSPIYYYFLSSLLFLGNNDILFLGYMNVLLQMLTLITVYFLAKAIFDKTTALIALILFSFTQGIIAQSAFVWQPHIMQPFVNLSFLFLLLSYKKKKYVLLLLSISTFILSLTFHYSALAVAPTFLFLAITILIIQWRKFKYFIGALFILITSLFILYLPLIIYLHKPSHLYSFSFDSKTITTLGQPFSHIVQNLISRTEIFFSFFFSNPNSLINLYAFIFAPIFFLTTAYYFFFLKQDHRRKQYMIILLGALLSYFAVTSLLTISPLVSFPPRHFTPIFGLFVIFLAEIVNSIFSKKFTFIKVFLLIFLLIELRGLSSYSIDYIFKNPSDLFTISYIKNPYVEAVKNEILDIQKKEGKDNLDFFQFISFRNGYEDVYVNEVFWTPLEKQLDYKLTRVNDNSYRDWEPLTTNEYLFLRCQFQFDENKECLDVFSKEYPNYRLVKKVVAQSPFSVYLTKRID